MKKIKRRKIKGLEKVEIELPSLHPFDKYLKYLQYEVDKNIESIEANIPFPDIKVTRVRIDYDGEYEWGEYNPKLYLLFDIERMETDGEMETRRKKSVAAKKAAEKRKENQKESERQQLFQLLKKHPDVLKKLKKDGK